MKIFMKLLFKHFFTGLYKRLHNAREKYYCWLGKTYPMLLVKIWYKHRLGRKIDLNNPKDINEKINWLKFNADTSLWSQCTDKFEVRNYVEDKGLGFTLNDYYGVYDKAEDIDFNSLPHQFVIKTTNGGGGKNVLIVKDKSILNVTSTIKKLNSWLRSDVGYRYYEPQYFTIKPRLIVEKYLHPQQGDDSLIDYKFHCFNGESKSILLCANRHEDSTVSLAVYDVDWNPQIEMVNPENRINGFYPRPKSLDLILDYNRILSKGIPYVRLDWYDVDGVPIFGEMTFTPAGGFMHKYSYSYLLELGQYLDLSLIEKK